MLSDSISLIIVNKAAGLPPLRARSSVLGSQTVSPIIVYMYGGEWPICRLVPYLTLT